MDKYELIKNILTELALLSIEFREYIIIDKEDKSPVTELDIINQYICEDIVNYFYPNDKIIAEENTNNSFAIQTIKKYMTIIDKFVKKIKEKEFNIENKSENIWFIDPIDGTKGFIDNKTYSIVISVTNKNELINSGIATIGLNTLFKSIPNIIIATTDGLKMEVFNDKKEKIILNEIDKKNRTIAISRKHRSKEIYKLLKNKNYDLIEIDSQAKYLVVALNFVDIYIREEGSCGNKNDYAWDHLAGIHLVKSIGGLTLDYNKNEPKFDTKDGRMYFDKYLITAKNLVIYSDLLENIRKENL